MKWAVLSATFAVLITLSYYTNNKQSINNVCKTFEDYYTDRDNNKNCYYNPDYKLTVPEIIRRHNLTVEAHNVTTPDGFLLTMFRIPADKRNSKNRSVFLQHGFGSTSTVFVNLGKKSLALILVRNGFDVWLGNFRGNSYSKNHVSLNDKSSLYWDFSFHEYGIYDIASQLEYVYNITNKPIVYIGYSIGTTSMYVYGVTQPELAAKHVDLFINLAPAVFVSDPGAFVGNLLKVWMFIEPLLQSITNGKLYSKLVIPLEPFLQYLCYPYPFQLKICQFPEMLVFGISYNQVDPETLPISYISNADWASVKGLSHVAQVSTTGNFRRFNYGTMENMEIYGSPDPPPYNLSKFSVPTYIIRSKNDLVVTESNVDKLYNSLPEHAKPYNVYTVEDEEFNHLDFVMGKDADLLVYNHVTDFITNN